MHVAVQGDSALAAGAIASMANFGPVTTSPPAKMSGCAV